MIGLDDVTAVLVTRGDVDLGRIRDALIWTHVITWNNALFDWGAYARYLAVTEEHSAARPVIYTQDDDCVVSADAQAALLGHYEPGVFVSNMHADHNAGMPELALPGWGCLFDRGLVAPTFEFWEANEPGDVDSDRFRRVGCDIVFPVLNRSKMVDLGHENLPWAWAPNRTHVQPGYADAKEWYYRRALALRPARVAVAA